MQFYTIYYQHWFKTELIFNIIEYFYPLKSAEVLSDTFEIVPIPRHKDYKVLEGEAEGGLISSDFIVQRILEKTAMIPVDNVESDEVVDGSESNSDAPVDVPAVPAQ